jgi:hypothetical protein
VEEQTSAGSRLDELRSSARGWHGVQLAVLGFIGLCGVLQGQADSPAPHWLKVVAGLLVLLALVLSCVATAMVASAAWPISGWRSPGESATADAADLDEGGRRLRLGVRITFVAVGTLALGAMSSWWPSPDTPTGAGSVSVTTSNGSICGEIGQASPGVLAIQTSTQRVLLRLDSVVSMTPVDSCG